MERQNRGKFLALFLCLSLIGGYQAPQAAAAEAITQEPHGLVATTSDFMEASFQQNVLPENDLLDGSPLTQVRTVTPFTLKAMTNPLAPNDTDMTLNIDNTGRAVVFKKGRSLHGSFFAETLTLKIMVYKSKKRRTVWFFNFAENTKGAKDPYRLLTWEQKTQFPDLNRMHQSVAYFSPNGLINTTTYRHEYRTGHSEGTTSYIYNTIGMTIVLSSAVSNHVSTYTVNQKTDAKTSKVKYMLGYDSEGRQTTVLYAEKLKKDGKETHLGSASLTDYEAKTRTYYSAHIDQTAFNMIGTFRDKGFVEKFAKEMTVSVYGDADLSWESFKHTVDHVRNPAGNFIVKPKAVAL